MARSGDRREYDTCQDKRRTRVDGKWSTGPCNVPLFGTKQRESGRCSACAAGISHEDNQPAGERRSVA